MYHSLPVRPGARRHVSISMLASSAVTLMFLCTATANAQVGGIDPDPGGGSGGTNTIQGTIFLQGGKRMDRRVKVKLVGIASGEQFQLSDDNGAFSFRRLQGGAYTVEVDAGREFEIAAERVDIVEPSRRTGDRGITVPVYITLQPRTTSPSRVAGTVDAKSAAIPEAARELYRQALESAASGDQKKAIDQLEKAIDLYPDFMAALNQLGVEHMALREWGAAGDWLRKAIKLAPNAFQPRLNFGIVLAQVKKYKEAAAELKIAVQREPASGTAQFFLGRVMVNLGNYDAAEDALRQTILIGSEEAVEAHRYLGAVYIEKQDSSRAADELETYLKLAPKAKDAERIRAIVKDLRRQASTAPR